MRGESDGGYLSQETTFLDSHHFVHRTLRSPARNVCFFGQRSGCRLSDGLTLYLSIGLRIRRASRRTGRQSGSHIQSIRFYERQRILREPLRTSSGYRVYSKSDLDDLCFIKQCQELGFTLKEIQPLLNLQRAAARMTASGVRRPAEFRDIAQLAQVKLEQFDQKMRTLKSMRLRLLGMIDRIETVGSLGCPGKGISEKRSRLIFRSKF
jgi:MerR family transcriptional regulator, copper efflux regulator